MTIEILSEAQERLASLRAPVASAGRDQAIVAGLKDASALVRQNMLAIRQSNGLTLAENEASCVVYGMPRAAHKRGAVSHMLSLRDICQLFATRSDDP